MSTHITHPVGASNINPNMATSATPGQEVTPPVGVTPVHAVGEVQGPSTASAGLVAAAKTFREALGLLQTALALYLRTMPVGDHRRSGAINARRVAATPLLAELLRTHPGLASVNPDDILGHMANGTAIGLVAQDLQALLGKAEDTERLEVADGWTGAGAVYAAASHQAKTDQTMAVKLEPVRAILKTGPRVKKAVVTTAVADHASKQAQTRTTRAQQRAVAASQSQSRAVQAHAAAHPTAGVPAPASVNQGPAVPTPADASVYQGPAPVPASVYQGPAVNPQGPAPGR